MVVVFTLDLFYRATRYVSTIFRDFTGGVSQGLFSTLSQVSHMNKRARAVPAIPAEMTLAGNPRHQAAETNLFARGGGGVAAASWRRGAGGQPRCTVRTSNKAC